MDYVQGIVKASPFAKDRASPMHRENLRGHRSFERGVKNEFHIEPASAVSAANVDSVSKLAEALE